MLRVRYFVKKIALPKSSCQAPHNFGFGVTYDIPQILCIMDKETLDRFRKGAGG